MEEAAPQSNAGSLPAGITSVSHRAGYEVAMAVRRFRRHREFPPVRSNHLDNLPISKLVLRNVDSGQACSHRQNRACNATVEAACPGFEIATKEELL